MKAFFCRDYDRTILVICDALEFGLVLEFKDHAYMFDDVKRLVGAVQLVNLHYDVEYFQVPVCYRVFLDFKIRHLLI